MPPPCPTSSGPHAVRVHVPVLVCKDIDRVITVQMYQHNQHIEQFACALCTWNIYALIIRNTDVRVFLYPSGVARWGGDGANIITPRNQENLQRIGKEPRLSSNENR